MDSHSLYASESDYVAVPAHEASAVPAKADENFASLNFRSNDAHLWSKANIQDRSAGFGYDYHQPVVDDPANTFPQWTPVAGHQQQFLYHHHHQNPDYTGTNSQHSRQYYYQSEQGDVKFANQSSVSASRQERPLGTPSTSRRRISTEQTAILESNFQENPRPNKAKREELSNQTGLALKNIQIWLQNRRAKAKANNEVAILEKMADIRNKQLPKRHPSDDLYLDQSLLKSHAGHYLPEIQSGHIVSTSASIMTSSSADQLPPTPTSAPPWISTYATPAYRGWNSSAQSSPFMNDTFASSMEEDLMTPVSFTSSTSSQVQADDVSVPAKRQRPSNLRYTSYNPSDIYSSCSKSATELTFSANSNWLLSPSVPSQRHLRRSMSTSGIGGTPSQEFAPGDDKRVSMVPEGEEVYEDNERVWR